MNQEELTLTVWAIEPEEIPITAAIEKPSSSAYSNSAHSHWKRADSLIPIAATASTPRLKIEPTSATQYLLLAALWLKNVSR